MFPFVLNQPPATPGGGFFIWILLMIAGMWFLIIAPQRKLKKQQEALIASLKRGDKVVTRDGLYGVLTEVKEQTISLEIAKGVEVRFLKQSVASVVKSDLSQVT